LKTAKNVIEKYLFPTGIKHYVSYRNGVGQCKIRGMLSLRANINHMNSRTYCSHRHMFSTERSN